MTPFYRFGYTAPRYFYPRPPDGGRHGGSKSGRSGTTDFYPRPPGGGRRQGVSCPCPRKYFYPRPPGGGRPRKQGRCLNMAINFYPRPPGGGRPVRAANKSISIHALRVEGDQPFRIYRITRPNFYPRPPGGGRRAAPPPKLLLLEISIHALRVEGDKGGVILADTTFISIHALRVEGDAKALLLCTLSQNFYPRPPGGGRPLAWVRIGTATRFLSTPSGWRATL